MDSPSITPIKEDRKGEDDRIPITLKCHLSPGDIVVLTAAVESLHLSLPGKYRISVDTIAKEIWEQNPLIYHPLPDSNSRSSRVIEMHYPAVNHSNQEGGSFLDAFVRFLRIELKEPTLRLRVNRPYIYLSEQEKKWPNQVQQHISGGKLLPFWLLSAGVKDDFTAKQWPVEYYQEVIYATQGEIQWVQIGSEKHSHPPLHGVINLVGQTSHRELIRLAYHSQGGLGPVTYLQHLVAAFSHPYLCLLGGREPITWVQSYPLQYTFHTIGSSNLHCCKDKACWKSRVVALNDGKEQDKSLCELPVIGLERVVPKCMAMIKPEEVISTIRRIRS